MVGSNKCFVPGCKTGYKCDRDKCKAEGRKVSSLFTPPVKYRELWNLAIPRADRNLKMSDRVCELHFPEDDIQRFDRILMKDGVVVRFERTLPKLKAGAVPLIFPNLPSYFSKGRRLLALRNALQCNLNKQKVDSLESKAVEGSSSSLSPSSKFDFGTLVSALGNIVKPSARWSIYSHPGYILCSKLGDDFKAERKVVINKELCIKVFLKDREINTDFECPCNIEDVSSILKEVDGYVLYFCI